MPRRGVTTARTSRRTSHLTPLYTFPMGVFEISAVLISVAAGLAFINARFLRLPTTIGLMLLALLHAVGVLLIGLVYPPALEWARHVLDSVDFNRALMHGMLGYLLFAGALHVNLDDLRDRGGIIATLATAGVLVTTTLVGLSVWGLSGLLGLDVPLIYCLLFGSLIAPTDPIAVLAILKSLGAPKDLEVSITGESLFNDGVGVVVFIALLGFAGLGMHADTAPTAADATPQAAEHAPAHEGTWTAEAGEVLWLFAKEAGGGAVLGLALGGLGFLMLSRLDDYITEVLISLAMVTGGYALATALHLSGPIAMVVAGLLIGNHGRTLAMSATTRQHLDQFWELVDEMLNAVLFVLIGLEVLVVAIRGEYLLAGAIAIPLVLLARFVSVGLAARGLQVFARRSYARHTTAVMTWAGLRGGISVALALSLRQQHHIVPGGAEATEVIVTMTYVVVVFSILVQGLTVGPMLRRLGLIGSGGPAGH